MLISVHLGKTAGTTFVKSLEQHFQGNILYDNSDAPINTPRIQRNSCALLKCAATFLKPAIQVGCIHGHLMPLKYRLYATKYNVKFVTWMRDPVERLASHYHHWMRDGESPYALPLHKKVFQEQWSLEKFCFSHEIKNYYSQFLWMFPINHFDFIGITEYFEDDFNFFCRHFIGNEIMIHSSNINPRKCQNSYFDCPDLVKRIQNYHSQDVALYNKALQMRNNRINNVNR